MNIALIVACTADGLIGRAGTLPWRLPADMRHFKSLSSGHTVLMGRKTYQSLYIRPLPNRRNIVLSRDQRFHAPGCNVIHRLEQLPTLIADEHETCFVIGGGEVFAQLFPYAHCIYQTLVEAQLDGDVWFPAIEPPQWQQEGERRNHPADDHNTYAMTFIKWRRNGSVRALTPNANK